MLLSGVDAHQSHAKLLSENFIVVQAEHIQQATELIINRTEFNVAANRKRTTCMLQLENILLKNPPHFLISTRVWNRKYCSTNSELSECCIRSNCMNEVVCVIISSQVTCLANLINDTL